jgi:hypothetical protein
MNMINCSRLCICLVLQAFSRMINWLYKTIYILMRVWDTLLVGHSLTKCWEFFTWSNISPWINYTSHTTEVLVLWWFALSCQWNTFYDSLFSWKSKQFWQTTKIRHTDRPFKPKCMYLMNYVFPMWTFALNLFLNCRDLRATLRISEKLYRHHNISYQFVVSSRT